MGKPTLAVTMSKTTVAFLSCPPLRQVIEVRASHVDFARLPEWRRHHERAYETNKSGSPTTSQLCSGHCQILTPRAFCAMVSSMTTQICQQVQYLTNPVTAYIGLPPINVKTSNSREPAAASAAFKTHC